MKLEFYHEDEETGLEEEWIVHVDPYEGMKSSSWYEPDEPSGFDFIKAVNSESKEILNEDQFYSRFPDTEEELEEMIKDNCYDAYLDHGDQMYDYMMDK